MYIIELLFKIKNDFKNKEGIFAPKKQEEKEVEKCFHTLIPIDSTGKILACSKCGFLIEPAKRGGNPALIYCAIFEKCD